MPLHSATVDNQGIALAIWQLHDAESLHREATARSLNLTELATIQHPKRYTESVAGRLALYEAGKLLGYAFSQITKDEFGKPHVTEAGYEISLTHSSEFAAAIVSQIPCGLDIEPIRAKLNRVCSKFLSEHELAHAAQDTERLCVYWTAKEAIYKLYGKRQLVFKRDIAIEVFTLQEEIALTGFLLTSAAQQQIWLRSLSLPGYRLTYTVPTPTP